MTPTSETPSNSGQPLQLSHSSHVSHPSQPLQSPQPADPFRRLVAIMARLRGEGGCPWDREQTHQTLTPYLIEEAYEVKDSLDKEDFDALREELGDLTLQIVFHAQLAKEAGRFNIDAVLDTICEKLVRRHPHVFGDVEVSGSGDVLKNWEEIKKQEKREKGGKGENGVGKFHSVLSGVPQSLPALLKAHRIQEKAANVGFDWPEVEPIWGKIHEEIDELREALKESGAAEAGEGSAARRRVAEEIGDLLFSIVNLSRRLGVPAEEALDMTNRKFMSRFRRIEERLHAQGKRPGEMTLDQLDALWEAVKAE